MKKLIIFSLLFLVFLNLEAQKKPQSLWEILKGKELESSITFLPVGIHTKDLEVFGVWYTSYNYKSYELAVFKNSFGDFTIAALYKRKQEITKNFSVIYGLGVMHGYHGKMQNVDGIPFRKTFLWTGEINPVGGLSLDYKISKKTSLQLSLTPLVFVYGFRYII